jgi:hypothetical protein
LILSLAFAMGGCATASPGPNNASFWAIRPELSTQEPLDPAGRAPEFPGEPDTGQGEKPIRPAYDSVSEGGPSASEPCTDNLSYMGDLTYPDRTKVLPGQPVEKRWKVRNSGTCDWGPDYRFRWNSGSMPPAGQADWALYPAIAGSEAVLQLKVTAPAAAGEYLSWWQAVSPSGETFGDMLSIDILVSP